MSDDEKRTIRLIEIGANIGIVIVALLCILIWVKNYGTRSDHRTQSITFGTQLSLKDVKWNYHQNTIIFALSTSCHFCNESAPFYRDLVKKCAHEHVHTIAVLPQPMQEASSYLRGEGVSLDEIKSASLGTIQVSGTPTLILVDQYGKVQDAWIGKLSLEQEKQVFSRLSL
jgi:hypothetical protein